MKFYLQALAMALTAATLCAAVPVPNHILGAFGTEANSMPLDNIDERGPYVEGDMIISGDIISTRAGIKDTKYRWPNREVVYQISNLFPPSQRQLIRDAISELASKTCLRFREARSGETDYVHVVNTKAGCYSNVGKVRGAQELNLGVGCVYKGIIIHEILHAIGFFHEQSRTDRDDYVTINYNNISPGKEHNFHKFGASDVDPFGVRYDYGSIMHYSAYAFSKNGQPTISVKQAGAQIGQRSGLSSLDVRKINNMYGC